MVPHGGLLSQPSLRTPLSCRLLAAVVHGDLDASGVHAVRRRGARTRRPLGQAARDGGPIGLRADMHVAAVVTAVAVANSVLSEIETLSLVLATELSSKRRLSLVSTVAARFRGFACVRAWGGRSGSLGFVVAHTRCEELMASILRCALKCIQIKGLSIGVVLSCGAVRCAQNLCARNRLLLVSVLINEEW